MLFRRVSCDASYSYLSASYREISIAIVPLEVQYIAQYICDYRNDGVRGWSDSRSIEGSHWQFRCVQNGVLTIFCINFNSNSIFHGTFAGWREGQLSWLCIIRSFPRRLSCDKWFHSEHASTTSIRVLGSWHVSLRNCPIRHWKIHLQIYYIGRCA